MPWKETSVIDERIRFISFVLEGGLSMSDLCREFGISRKTGYKLIHRYREHGLDGLKDMSRAPRNHPNVTPPDIEQAIIRLRGDHPKWGPLKLKDVLERDSPDTNWPVESTIGRILKRNGLISARKRRSGGIAGGPAKPVQADAPNETWCIDFKGQFKMGNGRSCYPLTISDSCSRMLLRCQAMTRPDTDSVKPILVAAFMEYGLPEVIRSDNGPPFASTGLGGLSRLSAWWLRLGIGIDRIDPGHPEQNGRHERMHRVLKEEATMPPEYDTIAQQRVFDRFRDEYNTIRPHQAIGRRTPSSIYVRSEREYPLITPAVKYPKGMSIRRVRHDGYIRWKGKMLYLTEALIYESVGIDRFDDDHLIIYYGPMPLAVLDDRMGKWVPRRQAAEIISIL